MRFLRNRSIATKLAASGGCALVLLIVLAWSAQQSLLFVRNMQQTVSEASETERQMQGALIAVQKLRVIGRVLQSAQTLHEITEALNAAAEAAQSTRTQLQAIGTREQGVAQQHDLATALLSLTQFESALQQEAAQRRTLIQTRQRKLMDARAVFESSVSSFADELAHGGVSQGGVDAVTGQAGQTVSADVLAQAKAAFTDYQLGMDHVQNAALLFLATGNRGAANEVRDSADTASQKIKTLLTGALPASTKSDVQLMATLGNSISQAAIQVVDQSIHLDDFVSGTLESVSRAMSDHIAAAAGEAGKGFAVVASEVTTLATQTARAIEDIAGQIAAMQGATAQAVEALRSINETICRMSEIATAIAAATEQQGTATQEIARAVQEAAAGSSEVTENIGQVAESVSDTSRQAAETLAAATELAAQSDTLRTQVDGFLSAIQQAA